MNPKSFHHLMFKIGIGFIKLCNPLRKLCNNISRFAGIKL